MRFESFKYYVEFLLLTDYISILLNMNKDFS